MLSGQSFESQEFTGIDAKGESVSACDFVSCTFRNCTIDSCVFEDCSLTDCVFQNCRLLSNTFKNTHLSEALFDSCAIIGVHFNTIVPSGFGSPFDSVLKCTLKYCFFENMDLTKVCFRGSDILESSFSGTNLTGADLSSCSLAGTEFFTCILQNADFRNSRGYIVDLRSCKSKGAMFSYPEAVHLLDSFGIKVF